MNFSPKTTPIRVFNCWTSWIHYNHCKCVKKKSFDQQWWLQYWDVTSHTNNSPHAFLIVQLSKIASQGEDGYIQNNMLLSGLECYEAAYVQGLMGVICQIILSHRDGQDKCHPDITSRHRLTRRHRLFEKNACLFPPTQTTWTTFKTFTIQRGTHSQLREKTGKLCRVAVFIICLYVTCCPLMLLSFSCLFILLLKTYF